MRGNTALVIRIMVTVIYWIACSVNAILCSAHVSSFSSVNSLSPTFVKASTDILETFPHDVASAFSPKRSAARPISWKWPNKNEGQKPPNFASNRNILSTLSRDVKEKQKIDNNYVHQWLLAYTFTKFGRGWLNRDGNQRARLYGDGKILQFLI